MSSNNDAGGRCTDLSTTATTICARLRAGFDAGITLPLASRRQQLDGLGRFLADEQSAIVAALSNDLGKPPFESWLTEINAVRNELSCAQRSLKAWARPRRTRTDLFNMPGTSQRRTEPLGVVLIIAPWNYPLCLSLVPAVSAMAAGNVVVLKPSEQAPAVAELLHRRLSTYVDPQVLQVVTGDASRVDELLDQPLDHVFYTGSSKHAPDIAAAAARQLTPVTLELGGKNPCYVDASADLDVAARRIMWGKLINAGQTCVAPDHLLVDRSVRDNLIDRLYAAILNSYGDTPLENPDYQRIVNRRHFDRLRDSLGRGTIVHGGQTDEASMKIAPTLICDAAENSALMQEEIFGPLLPIIPVAGIDEAISRMRSLPKPLAVYLFTRNRSNQRRILDATSSGGACINDVVMQLAGTSLPFGGVGDSGHGAYHGRAGFDTFSHQKSVLIKPASFELPVRYPPYERWRHKLLRRFG